MKENTPKIPALRSIYMYASGACNLNCSHCWINPEYQKADTTSSLHLDPVLVKKAVEQGKPLGLGSVKITGGEPLLNPRIKDIIKLISSEGMRIVIETNGTLIDRDMAEFLSSTEKFYFISVSLDGADARTHEELRRVTGSFDSAVQGIRNLVETGIRPQIICTLHRKNISQISEVIELAKDLGCGSVKFNHVQHVGRGSEFDEDLVLTVPEIIKLNDRLEEEIIPSAGILVILDIPLAFQKPARFLRSRPGRCTIHNIIGLLANGDLALCGIGTSVDDLLYGNLKADDLEDIWKNSPKLAELRRLIPDELEGICSKCVHKRFCKGTCVAANYNATGKLNAPYNFCNTAEKLGLFPESRMNILVK
ncbi:MAG: radical SAM protein [Candidatus Aegiribacteria sp.]|nr:radical SAM protein [Candidatus Aegiribacteria sp.]